MAPRKSRLNTRACPMIQAALVMAAVLPAVALAPAAEADNGVPTPAKVVIVVEENHGYSQIIGSASAPYINALAAGGALFTHSYALTHPSQPNYIAFFSGSTQGVTTDGMYPHSQFAAPNLGAKLLASPRGLFFGGYSETMPLVGFDGISAGTPPATYQRKHNPWVNWQDAGVPLPPNKLPPSVNMPLVGYWPTDYSTLPTLSFVMPNQLHDMHDGTVAQGDAWLQANLSAYTAWCRTHNGLLIVTFDEDDSTGTNRIATIFYGPMVVAGQYAEVIDHYRVLRTLEDMFGVPHTAGTISAAPILDIWAACAPTVAAQPSSAAACPSGSAVFGVTATGAGPLTYQWQIQTAPGVWQGLGNDPFPLPCGGGPGGFAFATPINSPTVQIGIRPCPGVNAYQIRCVVTNACGSVTSDEATYTICRADFNCDGVANSQDFFDFLAAFFAGGSNADFNHDGAVNSQDFFDFLTAFFAGC